MASNLKLQAAVSALMIAAAPVATAQSAGDTVTLADGTVILLSDLGYIGAYIDSEQANVATSDLRVEVTRQLELPKPPPKRRITSTGWIVGAYR
ncbi:MAG: hypothetical protein AAGA15_08055 [Pseudomonadota bacterium]